MSWMSAFGFWQWVVMASIPPAVLLLYFLKLRRQACEVPSTFLWRRAIEDMHVNSIWQKLRKNLLLYLQLLFLAAVILTCLRPGWSGSSEVGRRWIFLVDNSASMQASDVKPSRLEHAKSRIREQIATMQSDDVAMILAFSDRADVRQGFTGDKQKLLAAIERVEPTNRTTDLNEALRAAAGLANPGRASFGDVNDVQVADALPATIMLFSDGGFPPIEEFNLGNLKAEYVPIGEKKVDNVGILAFSVQRNEEKVDQVEAFGMITNSGTSQVSLVASLYLDDQLLDAANVTIEAGEEAGVHFNLQQLDHGVLRLQLDAKDRLSIDDVAYASLRPARSLELLLITPGNNALVTSLQTGPMKKLANVRVEPPSYLEEQQYLKESESGAFDLILYDQCGPKEFPSSNTLFIGSQPPSDSWTIGETKSPIMIWDWDRRHPAMQFLEMDSVRILEGRSVSPPEGGTVLMTSDQGPMMAIAPRGPFQDAVLGFPIITSKDGTIEVNTNWAIKRSFPVFVYSVVDHLGGGVTSSASNSVLPGSPMALTLSNRYSKYSIIDPRGRSNTIDLGEQSQWIYTQTETPGIYAIVPEGQKDPVELFAVNLFSPRESRLGIVEDLRLGGESVQVAQGEIFGRKEWWRWILLIGLSLLILEWIVYNRRVFI